MKRSRRELSSNVTDKRIFKNNQIALFSFLTFIPKTGTV